MQKLFAILSVFVFAGALSAASHVHDNSALDGTGSIAGTVTDSVTGLPVEGAKVAAGCCGGKYAYTNADGEYVITDLAAGEYNVKAMKDGYAMKVYPEKIAVAEGQQVEGIDFALAPLGGGGEGSISGTVYDKKTGAPIEGAKVMTGTCRNMRTAYTNADGQYTITGLADGEYTVKAMKQGYGCASYPDPVVISGGNAVDGIDFYLVPNCQQALD
jgi:large repetitive protein